MGKMLAGISTATRLKRRPLGLQKKGMVYIIMNSESWIIVGSIGQLLSAIFMVIGFIFVVWQIRSTNKVASADFILRLEGEFIDHYFGTYQKFLSGGLWDSSKKGPNNSKDISELENYSYFFANLQVLRTERLISIETIDKMFAYRFFISTNNSHTHQRIKQKRLLEYLFTLYSIG